MTMKILCPVDFSKASVNACKSILSYVNTQGGGEVLILHCTNLRGRELMFLKMDQYYQERAEMDMEILMKELDGYISDVDVASKIVSVDPKSFIAHFADQNDYDFIVVGTQGLTALKDMTIGSVTEYLINKSKVPVIAIPEKSDLSSIEVVVLGVHEHTPISDDNLEKVLELCRQNNAKLRVVHFGNGEQSQEWPKFERLKEDKDLQFKFEEVKSTGVISADLHNYCHRKEADLLVLIHRRQRWWQRIFTKSISKERLFKLDIPLLVLPGSPIE